MSTDAWSWVKSLETTLDQAKQVAQQGIISSPSHNQTTKKAQTSSSSSSSLTVDEVDEEDEFQDIEEEEQNQQEQQEQQLIRVLILSQSDTATTIPNNTATTTSTVSEQKYSQLTEQLRVREKQLEQIQGEMVTLRNENMKLTRLNEDIRSEAKEATDQFESLKNEFSERLAKEERKVMQLRKDKNELLKKSQQEALDSQNEKVEQLTREGEALSKKVGQLEQTVRKQKQNNQTLESEKVTLNKTIDSLKAEIESLKFKISEKENAQTEQEDIIKKFKTISSATSKELEQKNTEIDEAKKTILNLEKQLVEHKQLHLKVVADYDQQVFELHEKIDQLQETLSLTTDQAEKKQESLRREIDNLMRRVSMADIKNEDMITTLPDTTRPLLQQIEMLEKATIAKEEQWKDVEQRLNYKLKIAENNLKLSQREQQKLQNLLDQQKITSEELQKQINLLNRELLTSTDVTEKLKQQLNVTNEIIQPLQRENTSLKHEIEQLQNLFGESRSEIEKLYQQLEKYKTTQQQQIQNGPTVEPVQQQQQQQQQQSSSRKSIELIDNVVVDDVQSPVTTSGVSRLHSIEIELRNQNAKVQILLKRVEELEDLKDKLTDELVSYTNTNKKLTKQITDQSELRQQFEELQKNYETALELIGEKEETISDMQQDMKYVKEKFRIQVTSLLEEIDQLKKS
jgi:chromosome segregation ATPase